ncbi:Protein of unknown function, partial [Gryllus bimaculatus]
MVAPTPANIGLILKANPRERISLMSGFARFSANKNKILKFKNLYGMLFTCEAIIMKLRTYLLESFFPDEE